MSGVAGTPSVNMYLGDCLDFLRDNPCFKPDAVVSDPPYGMKWDTDCTRFSGGSEASKLKRGEMGGHNWEAPVIGDSVPFDPAPFLRFRKVILWGSNHFAARLPVGTTLVWVKRNEAAYGTFLSDAETAWMKGGHGVYLHKDLSMNALAKTRLHPNQKPVGLMEWCIKKLRLKPGATIFDPYVGSGTTALAAKNLGFNFVGCEIEPDIYETACRRLGIPLVSSVAG